MLPKWVCHVQVEYGGIARDLDTEGDEKVVEDSVLSVDEVNKTDESALSEMMLALRVGENALVADSNAAATVTMTTAWRKYFVIVPSNYERGIRI